jgi:hypothetical protein
MRSPFRLWLLCVLLSTRSQGADPSAQPLRGVQAFHVVIEPIEADAQAAGLTAELLRKDAELRLQAAGIYLVAAPAKPQHATLSITVRTAKGEKEDFAFDLVVRVLQNASLTRAPDIILPMTPTWELAHLDNVGPPAAKMPGWVRPMLAEMMKRLIEDYRRVNPGPPAR